MLTIIALQFLVYSGWSTGIASMRLGLGIMQVDILEDEVNGRASDQI